MHAELAKKRGLVAELSHRHVLRAAAVYVGAVWALSQGIAQLGPVFGAPDWSVRWFVIACAVGFPFWVGFAWYYKLTPEGLKRESDVAADDPAFHRATGRKLDFWIIGVMAVAIVLLITNQFVLHRDATSAADIVDAEAITAELAKAPFKSVAVLPLTSDDPKQQYFSDGLSEELISDLTQVNGLKVIGKYSSFRFRDSKDSLAQIGAALGVAHLIQGSVRQQDDRIRVTVSMISAKDGTSVWSHSYNEQLKDVFAIQSKIGEAVAAALKIKLLGDAIVSSDQPPSGNVEAYRLMLQGHTLARRQTEAGYRQGITVLEQALQLDPNYAYAWGVLSTAFVNEGLTLTGEARQQAYAQARTAADRQQVLAPDAAATHMNRGYLLANIDNDPVGALAEFRRGLQLAPHDGTAMTFLAYGLANIGEAKQAAALFREAINTDPFQASWYAPLVSMLMADGQLDDAERAARKALVLQPGFPGMYANLALIDILRGNAAAAERDAAQESDPVFSPWVQAMAQQVGNDKAKADAALREYIARYGATEPYLVADLYAVRKQPDDMFKWLDRAWDEHDPYLSSIVYDPFPLGYRKDPRFAALCQRAGLPVPGQPVAVSSTSNLY
ncbi:MAG TPA: hypothetical protein VJ862_11185 [Rhodanobacteraceae bacterium]|nr:hypothetical protein [Rhodanobacteraceae bacterium]